MRWKSAARGEDWYPHVSVAEKRWQ